MFGWINLLYYNKYYILYIYILYKYIIYNKYYILYIYYRSNWCWTQTFTPPVLLTLIIFQEAAVQYSYRHRKWMDGFIIKSKYIVCSRGAASRRRTLPLKAPSLCILPDALLACWLTELTIQMKNHCEDE